MKSREIFHSDLCLQDNESQPPEILYIWPYLPWGGVQIYLLGIMKHAKERFVVKAVMPEGSSEKLLGYFQHLGISYDFFNAHLDTTPYQTVWPKIRRRLRDAYCHFVIGRYLSKKLSKKNILHVDFAPWSAFILLLYLSIKSNVFITLHIAVPKLSKLHSYVYKFKFNILCMLSGFHLLVSNIDMLNSIKPYLPDHYTKYIPIAYTGVDVREIEHAQKRDFDRASLCSAYGLPIDRFFVLSLGQLVHRKGCCVLLEVAKNLCLCYPELFFVWVGDGDLRIQMDQKIRDYGLQNTVRIISPSSIGPKRLDLLSVLRLADIFVHPSFSEGLPGALLEAMALGNACVATCVNAIPEVIKDHETGLLVPPGDCLALGKAIIELRSDGLLRYHLGTAAREFVLSRFDEQLAAQLTIGCYEDCIECILQTS